MVNVGRCRRRGHWPGRIGLLLLGYSAQGTTPATVDEARPESSSFAAATRQETNGFGVWKTRSEIFVAAVPIRLHTPGVFAFGTPGLSDLIAVEASEYVTGHFDRPMLTWSCRSPFRSGVGLLGYLHPGTSCCHFPGSPGGCGYLL